MANRIHATAVVDAGAELGDGIEVGPYCVVGEGVRLGDGCRLVAHVVLQGPSDIGPENEFHPFASVGGRTQAIRYGGEPTRLKIGRGNCFRECVTINRGNGPGDVTEIGSGNHLLAYAHVGHDCRVGDHCVFSNSGTLGGHVVVEDRVIIGGLSAVHQFCRLGRFGFIGGCAKVEQDLPPFMLVDGNPAEPRGVNSVGLRRHGVAEETIRMLKEAFRLLYRSGLNTTQAVERISAELGPCPEIDHLVAFIRASERGIIH
ncbi:MAG: acyl-ACP--UDP-N-acetylglucosamine O-acyltransferase [Verrucomicrobiae bacterium]|nr:acyl-ACP--UDP-N-acetylglucosamine O-acyltransferase [Verrucomicrobiae bacterium]